VAGAVDANQKSNKTITQILSLYIGVKVHCNAERFAVHPYFICCLDKSAVELLKEILILNTVPIYI
jgi:hypothetical protein